MHDNVCVCYHVWNHDSLHSTSWGYCAGFDWDDSSASISGIFTVETAPLDSFFKIGSPN